MKLSDAFWGLVLIIVSVVMTVGIFYSVEHLARSNERQLPYSRPHVEFTRDDGIDCAAWIVVMQGAYAVLCENEPVAIVPVHEVHRMKPEGSINERQI